MKHLGPSNSEHKPKERENIGTFEIPRLTVPLGILPLPPRAVALRLVDLSQQQEMVVDKASSSAAAGS